MSGTSTGFASRKDMVKFVERRAPLIVKILKHNAGRWYHGEIDWDAEDTDKAQSYIYDTPEYLPHPTFRKPKRSTEPYFLAWSRTKNGVIKCRELWSYYDPVVYDIHAPRFLRLIATSGSTLNHIWHRLSPGKVPRRFSPRQKMVFAFLGKVALEGWEDDESLDHRKQTRSQVVCNTISIFHKKCHVDLPKSEVDEMELILDAAQLGNDHDITLIGNNSAGEPMFYLAPGREEIIFNTADDEYHIRV